MSVEIFIDPFNASEQVFDIVVQGDRASIFEARSRINENLESGAFRKLTVCLPNEGVIKRFSDFFGVKGVKVTRAHTPREQITALLDDSCPAWLDNTLIVDTGLYLKFAGKGKVSRFDLYKQIFSVDDGPLELVDFCVKLEQHPTLFMKVLPDVQFGEFWSEKLIDVFTAEEICLLIREVCSNKEPSIYLGELAYSQQIKKFRIFASIQGIDIALPPPSVSTDLLGNRDLMLNSERLESLVDVAIALFDECMESREDIREGMLLQLPLLPVSAVVEHMSQRLLHEYTPACMLFTEKLIIVADSVHAEKLQRLLVSSAVEMLEKDADIERAVIWLDSYFEALRDSWANGTVLAEGAETSFSDWLLENRPRVDRSSYSWTSISRSVKSSLKNNEVVVVYMVDALSGIHLDSVQQLLAEALSDHQIRSNYCFAPIPTLTEVGKNAVLTGRSPASLKGSSEAVVLQAYKDCGLDSSSILTHKSWTHDKVPLLNENTRLYLYLENRLDEGLHDSKQYEEYSKYDRTVSFTLKQIGKHAVKVYSAAKRLGKTVKFIVTADHGVTRSSGEISLEHPNKKERLLFDASPQENFDEFYSLNTDISSLGRCYIPKNRDCFHEVAFAHGGLTPEEVMIPWVEVIDASNMSSSFLIKDVTCHSTGDRSWTIKLNIDTSYEKDALTLVVEQPLCIDNHWFNGDYIHIALSSNVDLEGRVKIPLSVKSDGLTVYSGGVEAEFPKSMIQKDAGANEFESMFEL